MTPHEEMQLVAAIEQAVSSGITPMRSTRPCTCAVCGSEIAIGAAVVDLPGRFVVCGDCFELFTISPGPRPME